MAVPTTSSTFDVTDNVFPVWSLLPKKETGAASFMNRNPTFDGRGVKIAILDSGVDPGAPGLSVTTEGKPKVIHICDPSGAGDVDTSVKVSINPANNTILGLKCRHLRIPDTWPTALNGEYHVGLKSGYELYPKCLKTRVSSIFTEQKISPQLNNLRAHVLSESHAFKEKQDKLKDQEKSNSDKLLADEYQAKQNLVDGIQKLVKDRGPAYDVICFNDGNSWKVCIDTSEIGDLSSCKLLGPYSEAQEFATLTQLDRFNYGVNVHNEGNLVEIVGIASAHGTHVASIAAANFPDEPEKNGVAPGAQIISISIGDCRIGAEETGTAIIRGISKAIELGADIINMSYGEHSFGDSGIIMEVMDKAITKYGVIFVCSAGNGGPALSTMGTPPGCLSDMIAVGAWVAPDLMSTGYSLREKLPATFYTWTSRGPTIDGALGVTICAPGGAITSVPNFSLKNNQLMNGTSMSSPNTAGCIALLLSGLKQKNIPYSPFSIKRSLQNTAWKPSIYDAFAMGAGVVSVEKAFDHLEIHSSSPDCDIRFKVKVSCAGFTGLENNRGIYLREPKQTKVASVHCISVEPSFLNDITSSPVSAGCSDIYNTQRNIDFDMNFVLACDAHYVSTPSYLSLSYMERSFGVKVDPTGLNPGVHYTSIRAYDTSNQEKGVMFEIPITIIKTLQVTDKTDWKIDFPEMTLRPDMDIPRFFIEVPDGATSAIFEISHKGDNDPATIMFHTVQLVPQKDVRAYQTRVNFVLQNQGTMTRCFPVISNQTLECTFGKFWSSLGHLPVKSSIKFFGLSPLNYSSGLLALNHGEQLSRIDLISSLKRDEIQPSLTLKHLATPLKPSFSKISPLTTRDNKIFGVEPTYELILTYAFSTFTKVSDVTFDCRLTSHVLYENEYESQMWMLFDSNKSHLATGDFNPNKYSVDLDKGDYTLKFQIRHKKHSMVKRLEDIQILMLSKLNGGINLDIYASYSDGVNAHGKKFKDVIVDSKTIKPIYIASLNPDRLPKGVSLMPGSFFKGSLVLSKLPIRSQAETFPVIYNIDGPNGKPPQPIVNMNKKPNQISAKQPDSTTAELPTKSTDDDGAKNYQEALLDFKLNWLAKLEGFCADQVFKELDTLKEEHQATRSLNYLKSILNEESSGMNLDKLIKIESHCDDILDKVKPSEVLSQITIANKAASVGTPSVDKTSKAKDLDKLKNIIVETMIKKGNALCYYILDQRPSLKPDAIDSKNNSQTIQGDDKSTTSSNIQYLNHERDDLHDTVKDQLRKLDDLYFELSNWIELSDPRVTKLIETHAVINKHYGRAITSLMSQKEVKMDLEFYMNLMMYFRLMGGPWNWVSDMIERSLYVRCPESYRPF